MIVRPPAQRPVELPLAFGNGKIVDTSVPHIVKAVVVKLPVLIAIGTKPVTGIVAPLVRETNRDAISCERPQLFDQPILQLLRPFALQEFDDGSSPGGELGPISPSRIHRIAQ